VSGDANLVAGNVKYGVSIFTLTGTYAKACTVDGEAGCFTDAPFVSADPGPWQSFDLRYQFTTSLGGRTGALEFRRNGTSTDFASGPLPSPNSTDDTTDDARTSTGAAPISASPWNTIYRADAARDWIALANGAAASCTTGADDCVMQDRNTGLWWSEQNPVPSSAVSLVNTKSWSQAIVACDDLSFANKTDWRAPTQKEWMQAYIDGIAAVIKLTPLFADEATLRLERAWTASTSSIDTTEAWQIGALEGRLDTADPGTADHWFCVRP
jgi:hypothetical protein